LQLESVHILNQAGTQLSDAAKRKPALFKVIDLQKYTAHPD